VSRAEAVGGDAVEICIAGGEITTLPENRGRGETSRKRSCVGEDNRAEATLIYRVQIVVSVNR
jgi:hypothetical protein